MKKKPACITWYSVALVCFIISGFMCVYLTVKDVLVPAYIPLLTLCALVVFAWEKVQEE